MFDLRRENCLNTMSELQDDFIDLTVTSPPYDSVRDYKKDHTWNFDVFSEIAKELFRITKDGGIVTWVVADETKDFCESLTSFKQAIYFVEECGFKLLDTMIYGKNGGPPTYPGLMRYNPRFEYIFVLVKGRKPKVFNPLTRPNKDKYVGKLNTNNSQRKTNGDIRATPDYIIPTESKRDNVWFYDVGYKKISLDDIYKHPATMPEKLAQDLILSFSNENDIVFDPFLGSGTTAKMALINKRQFIGSEVNEEYFTIAKERLSKYA